MFVYLITNTKNGKKYVGQHSGESLEAYWKHCCNHAVSGSKDKPCLYNAVRKYGVDSFLIEPLVIVETKQEMDKHEIDLIKSLNTRRPFGYNLTEGGDGVLGLKHTEEAKEKNRLAHLGRKDSDETKEKKRLTSLGRKHSEDTKRRMSEHIKSEEHCKKISIAKLGNNAMLGKRHSEESRLKMSLSSKGRKFSEETKQKMREAQLRRRERERNASSPTSNS